jgi:tRNA(adenine34) deaminase
MRLEGLELLEEQDEHFMEMALRQAQYAFDDGEVPIGAVVVAQGRVIGRGYNQVERLRDATAHAEMIALTAACNHIGGKYLPECTLYVTVEPCVMCAGALKWAQLGRVVWGAPEDKYGFTSLGVPVLHPRTKTKGGVLADDCRTLMQVFFQQQRKRNDK